MAPPRLPKAKGTKTTISSPNATSLAKIAQLGSSLLEHPYNPNNLVPLNLFSRDNEPEVVHKAIWALHRVFVKYIQDGKVGGLTSSILEGGERGEVDSQIVDAKEGGREVKSWVRERLLEYAEVLGGLLRDSEEGLRTTALTLLFSLLPALSASVSQQEPSLHTVYFRLIMSYIYFPTHSLRGAEPRKASSSTKQSKWEIRDENQIDEEEGVLPPDVAALVSEDFWAKYDDLRWAYFRETTRLLQADTLGIQQSNLFPQLLPLTNLPKLPEDINTFYIPHLSASPSSSTPPPAKKSKLSKKSKKAPGKIDALPDWMATYDSPSSSEDESAPTNGKKRIRTSQLSIHASIHSVSSHIASYTSLWETILSKIELEEYWTRRILVGLHGEKGILGHMKPERRVRVADWLGGLVDRGGVEAVLAMNGLYVLMTKYNFDYPNFYQRLYGLLDADLMHVKYRARFFRLLDVFLGSTLLPAALVASFIKRLSLLALSSPPSGIIAIIPFIYNLFKRHPGTMIMIQRLDTDPSSPNTDPYNPSDPSPLTSKAIESSSWELKTLQRHYLSSVATLAKIFGEAFTKAEYNLEDFLDHGYGTLFDSEMARKLKYAPALATAIEVPENNDVGDPFPVGEREAVDVGAGGGDIVSQLWSF